MTNLENLTEEQKVQKPLEIFRVILEAIVWYKNNQDQFPNKKKLINIVSKKLSEDSESNYKTIRKKITDTISDPDFLKNFQKLEEIKNIIIIKNDKYIVPEEYLKKSLFYFP